MPFILGRKLNMSQVFNEKGKAIPVTLIEAGPAVVVQVKDAEKDGYRAAQIGFGERKEKNIKKPQLNSFKNLGLFAHLKEFGIEEDEKLTPGDKITVEAFTEGDKVFISGISKGKGFQGVVKRHGFAGGPGSHGQKHTKRTPGSIGATGPQRVMKGQKMAGRMGGERVTVKGLKVVKIDKNNNVIAVLGAVPGARNSLLEIRSANFK